MDKTYGTKEYAADKIAFLGLFIIALLIAYFIVASRSALVLSEPIKLDSEKRLHFKQLFQARLGQSHRPGSLSIPVDGRNVYC